ncbi:hypothetical protein ILYODFUR_023506 [Ilyodon furcidens]|uniref:Uncharacterized protein n=1 Tax=Ilyodon furcidens TaxID=33524 RepID=A0ABV0UIH0_9TELE
MLTPGANDLILNAKGHRVMEAQIGPDVFTIFNIIIGITRFSNTTQPWSVTSLYSQIVSRCGSEHVWEWALVSSPHTLADSQFFLLSLPGPTHRPQVMQTVADFTQLSNVGDSDKTSNVSSAWLGWME